MMVGACTRDAGLVPRNRGNFNMKAVVETDMMCADKHTEAGTLDGVIEEMVQRMPTMLVTIKT